MQILLRWAISAGALFATVSILAQFQHLAALDKHAQWYGWFVAAVVMGLVNALIRPIARMLTAPLNCLTFGLVGFLVNGLMFFLVPLILKSVGMPVFSVTFLGAIIGAILVGAIGGIANSFLKSKEED